MTDENTEQIRALLLLSGGLDSRLAFCLLRDQNIDVHGIVFESPFFETRHAYAAADEMNIPVHSVNFSKDIASLLTNPPHGFGSCMNPCIDCHARMLKRAGEMLEELGARFLATGEVLDERPMSQNRKALDIVARESGYQGLILRPLSAKCLPETAPEQRGWVNRNKLLDLRGRGRKAQFRLAEHYGIRDYPQPAGGCRLTEPGFAERLRDLIQHEGLNGVRSLYLLRVGRHFRLSGHTKLIVGRNEKDNAQIEGHAELYDLILKPVDIPGPTALLPFTATEDEIQLSAAICGRYSDCHDSSVNIRIRSSRGTRNMRIEPAPHKVVEQRRV